MTLPAHPSETSLLDTLNEYQWLSIEPDPAFAGLLSLVLKTTHSQAAGLSVRALDSIRYKAGEGSAEFFDGRLLTHCQSVMEKSESLSDGLYSGVPLITPEGLVIGALFVAQTSPDQRAETLAELKSFAAMVMIALEARRSETRLQAARSELQSKQKALSETKKLHRDFLSHLSHEMRTPLHAILGLSELLLDETHKAHHPKLAHNLTKSSQHMLETLNVLLEHARLEATTLRLQLSSFSLAEFLEETLLPFEMIIQSRGLGFEKRLALPEAAICSADRVRLRQVLNNLISNALKFTDQGSIRIEVEEVFGSPSDDRRLFAFRVVDTGLGIHRFNHDLLFEPYRQVPGDSSKGGSGLGLSICKRIVETMEGQIGLESEFGKGSTFWFKIPLKITEGERLLPAPLLSSSLPESEARDARDGRVLVIEDNSINRALTVKTLEQNGYTVASAASLDEVTRQLDAQEFDLVLLDLHLGELEPSILLREVRNRSAAPLVAISGTRVKAGDERSDFLDDSLQKPYTRDALVKMVDYWIFSRQKVEHLNEGWEASLASLDQSCGTEFVHQTIKGFVQRHPLDIQKLRRYLLEENWAKLELAAHSMKSTLATLGLMELSRLVTEVEEVSPTQDRAHLESLLEQFRIDSRRSYPQLLAYVKKAFTLMPCEIAS